MYAQVEKPKENKSRAVANSVAQKKTNVKQGFGFVDNRPHAIAQRRLQSLPNHRLRVVQCGAMTYSDNVQKHKLIQSYEREGSIDHNVIQRAIYQSDSGRVKGVDAFSSKVKMKNADKTILEEIIQTDSIVISFEEGAANLKETIDQKEIDKLLNTNLPRISDDLTITIFQHLASDLSSLYNYYIKDDKEILECIETNYYKVESAADLQGIIDEEVKDLVVKKIKSNIEAIDRATVSGAFGFLSDTIKGIAPSILIGYFINTIAESGVFDPPGLNGPPPLTDFRRLFSEILTNSGQYNGRWNATGPHYGTNSGPGREWEILPKNNPWESDGVLHTHVDKIPMPTTITKAHVKPKRLKFAPGFARYDVPVNKCLGMGITP